jgi:hypothetical protein
VIGVKYKESDGNNVSESYKKKNGEKEDEGIGENPKTHKSESEETRINDSERKIVGDVKDDCMNKV